MFIGEIFETGDLMKNYNCSSSKSLSQEITIRSIAVSRQLLPFIFLVAVSLGLFVLADKRLNQPPSAAEVPSRSSTTSVHKSLHQISAELEYNSSI